MKPVKFKHQNVVYAENQPEYMPLPTLKIDSTEGEVISCWKMTFKERIIVLFTGRIWLSLLSFNKPLTPSYLTVNRKEIYRHPDDENTMWAKLMYSRPIRWIRRKYLKLKDFWHMKVLKDNYLPF